MLISHQAFLSEFDDERKPLLEEMLKAIKEVQPKLSEIIKWNVPSFSDNGKDRLTIMLHKKDRVGLILHTGAKPKEVKKAPPLFEDSTGLLEWNSNIRATISFSSMEDFFSTRNLFKQAIKDWIVQTKDM